MTSSAKQSMIQGRPDFFVASLIAMTKTKARNIGGNHEQGYRPTDSAQSGLRRLSAKFRCEAVRRNSRRRVLLFKPRQVAGRPRQLSQSDCGASGDQKSRGA